METIAQLPAVLQFGAFGLLTIILIGVGVWVRSSLNRSQQFIEEVAKSALLARDEYTKAFQALAERNIVMQEKMVACMQQQGIDMQREQVERSKEHEDITDLLNKVLNGRRKDAEAEIAALKAKGS